MQMFAYTYAARGCTQEDAPALEIYLTQSPYAGKGDPTPPYLRIEIASSPAEKIAPLTLRLSALRRAPEMPGRIARAELVEESPAHPVWLTGTVTLDDATPGKQVGGRYDLATPDGRQLRHAFAGEYSVRPNVCGG